MRSCRSAVMLKHLLAIFPTVPSVLIVMIATMIVGENASTMARESIGSCIADEP